MTTHNIFANKSVSASDLRKQPCQYFTDEPIAVLSHNKTAGYMVGAKLFEELMLVLKDRQNGVDAVWQPTRAELKDIASKGVDIIEKASDEDLSMFNEHT